MPGHKATCHSKRREDFMQITDCNNEYKLSMPMQDCLYEREGYSPGVILILGRLRQGWDGAEYKTVMDTFKIWHRTRNAKESGGDSKKGMSSQGIHESQKMASSPIEATRSKTRPLD